MVLVYVFSKLRGVGPSYLKDHFLEVESEGCLPSDANLFNFPTVTLAMARGGEMFTYWTLPQPFRFPPSPSSVTWPKCRCSERHGSPTAEAFVSLSSSCLLPRSGASSLLILYKPPHSPQPADLGTEGQVALCRVISPKWPFPPGSRHAPPPAAEMWWEQTARMGGMAA